jgi:hypothetical protein
MTNEHWIEWEGGEMPVDPNTLVEVVFDNALQWDGKAKDFDWSARPEGITQYRVVDLSRMEPRW